MDYFAAYSAQPKGSNQGARRVCLAQEHHSSKKKKMVDSTGILTQGLRSESQYANQFATYAPYRINIYIKCTKLVLLFHIYR